MKQKTILILFFILMLFELTGCQNKKNNNMLNDDNSNANYENDTYILSDNTDVATENDIDESNDITAGENISNTSDNSKIIFEDVLLENYIEKQIYFGSLDAVPKESFTSSVYNKDGYIEHYFASDVKGDTIVWKYTLNDDDTLRKEEVTWLNQLKNKIDRKRITVLMGEDGNYYAHYVESNERSHLVKKEGDGFVEIFIRDWDITENRDFYMVIDQAAVLKNGNIVMASRNRTCYVYSKDSGEIIDTFPCGQYYSMITKDNYVIVLNDASQSARSVVIYDAEQGRIVNEIYGDFDSATLFFVDKDTLYACCKKGILKTGLTEDSWTRVLESGVFRFSNQDPFRFYVKNNNFYVLYHSDFNNIMKYTKRTEEEKVTDELKIYSLRDNSVIREAIVEFQLKYPEIQVTYEVGEVESGSTTLSDSIRILNTKIMNGEGPDIFLLEGLPVDSYIEKGILVDLQEEIKEYRAELHQGILNEFVMEDGSIYTLPLSFSLPLFYTVPESEKGIYSLNDLVDLSESMSEPLTLDMTFDEAVYLLYNYYTPEIISEKDEILTDNIKEFMMLAKRFCDSENVRPEMKGYSYESGLGGLSEFVDNEIKLIFYNMNGTLYYFLPSTALEQIGSNMHTNQNSFIPVGLLGINQLGKNKAIAFLFLKEVLSYDIQSKNYAKDQKIGFPVNQSAIEKIRETDMSWTVGDWIRGSEHIGIRGYNKQEASELVDIINNLDKCWPMNETLFQILKEEAIPYLKGSIGIDSAVEKIKNRLELYLFE